MIDWKITIEVWPYFGTNQDEVAPRVREFIRSADDFDDAHKIAVAIMDGIASHSKIWKANLWAVTRYPCPAASIT